MKKKKWNRLFSVLFVMVTVISLLSGCGRKSAEKEDAETITVYLWSTQLYEKYAPYIQKQLPDINIEFVVGNNDLDFYRFLKENGGLPDIITCCRFSLHDASPLKDSLMDLSTTNEAGAVYNTYINSFTNQDGSVNWLPVCADAHGFVVNRDLFAREKRIVEICDSLSIGAAVENMILTATGYGLGTLWIANTCFAYNELIEFIGTDNQLTGIVAVGAANEAPPKRPRKALRDVVEYR